MPNNANQRNSMTRGLLYATLGVGYIGFSGYLAYLSLIEDEGLSITDKVSLTQNQCSALSFMFGICGFFGAAIGFARAYYSYTADREWQLLNPDQQTDAHGNRPGNTEQLPDSAVAQKSDAFFANHPPNDYLAAGATDIHCRDIESQISDPPKPNSFS